MDMYRFASNFGLGLFCNALLLLTGLEKTRHILDIVVHTQFLAIFKTFRPFPSMFNSLALFKSMVFEAQVQDLYILPGLSTLYKQNSVYPPCVP
jgi:hypothetical protein